MSIRFSTQNAALFMAEEEVTAENTSAPEE